MALRLVDDMALRLVDSMMGCTYLLQKPQARSALAPAAEIRMVDRTPFWSVPRFLRSTASAGFPEPMAMLPKDR